MEFSGFDSYDMSMWTPLASRQIDPTSAPPKINAGPLIVGLTMLAASWTAISLRFYTRIRIVKNIGWDDITMAIAIVFFTVFAGADLKISVSRTAFAYMSFDEITVMVTAVLIVMIFYVATMIMLKISLGIFLLRITIKKWQKRIIYVALAFNTTWGVVTLLFAIFQCGYPKNATYYMEKRVFNQCVHGAATNAVTFTHGVISTLTDLTFTVLPLFILRDAKMNKRAKILLSIILSIGGIGSIASLVRFLYLKHLAYVTTDFFVHSANLVIWSILECGLGITAGSFATLRPLFRKFIDTAKDVTRRASMYSRRWSGSAKRGSVDTYSRIFRHSRSGSGSSGSSSGPKKSYEKDPELGYPYGFDWACAGQLDGKTPDGSRMGNETTITVGMAPEMTDAKSLNKPRAVSFPTGHGWNGGIEREMVFETSSSRYSSDDSSSTKTGGDESVKSMPKAWVI